MLKPGLNHDKVDNISHLNVELTDFKIMHYNSSFIVRLVDTCWLCLASFDKPEVRLLGRTYFSNISTFLKINKMYYYNIKILYRVTTGYL